MTRIWKAAWRVAYRWRMQARADATGQNLLDHRHFKPNGECFACPTCGAGLQYFTHETRDTVNGIVCEEDSTCGICGTHVEQWAYGAFNPMLSQFWPRTPPPVLSTGVDKLPMRTLTN